MAGRLVVWLGSWVRGDGGQADRNQSIGWSQSGRTQGLSLNQVVCHLNPFMVLRSLGTPILS